MPEFIHGLDLSGHFYAEAVRPILERAGPDLIYSAALIGPGSEVLGYDTVRSTDHNWGPRLLLFLAEDAYPVYRERIDALLAEALPPAVRGYSTHFGAPDAEGTRVAAAWAGGPIAHKVEIHTVRAYFTAQLGVDPTAGLAAADWLTIPEQRLLELTAGHVYHDGLGTLAPLRAQLAYYPREVWLARLAAQWRRIGEQEAFVGRAGDVGDDLGSRLIAAALVHDLMRLAFLLERRYAPYAKWFGTAFARLVCAPRLGPAFAAVLAAASWPAREARLGAAYEQVGALHDALGLTPPLAARVSPYYNRPYQVIHAGRFVAALEQAGAGAGVPALGAHMGAVDQFTDSTAILAHPEVYGRFKELYA